MKILHKATNQLIRAVIEIVNQNDWITIKESEEFVFEWEKEKSFSVYKIRLANEDKILGLIAIEDIPKEYRIHIRLIENSNTNKGKLKEYDFIAGCLIAKACEESFDKNYGGFVSLKPKSEIVNLYIKKYGFQPMGQFLFIELQNSESLIHKYLENE